MIGGSDRDPGEGARHGPIRCLVADPVTGIGERAARLLRTRPEFSVVSELADPPATEGAGPDLREAALAALREERPDAAFLAVSPGVLDGFEVLEAAASEVRPAVVFLAETDDHASRAFEVGAVDYLTPPCSPRRLWKAVERLRSRLGRVPSRAGSLPGGVSRAGAEEAPTGQVEDRYLTVNHGDAYKLVDLQDLRWAEAARNYVRLHTEDGSYLIRTSLRKLERRLEGPHFVRIHRSALVNVGRIHRIVPLQWGDCRVELDSGEELRMSRTYRDNLL